jgi:hypothetical protein
MVGISNYLFFQVLNIVQNDKLTKFICVDCEMTIHHFSEFCEMVKKVQKNLKSHVKSFEAEKKGQVYQSIYCFH